MKKVIFLIITCFLLSIPNMAICGDWTGNINVFLGAKALNEQEWDPAHEQVEIGVEFDFKNTDWPVSIAIDLLGGSGEGSYWGVGFQSITSELNLGVRKIWDSYPSVRPFIGGGISYINGEFSGLGLSDDDRAAGIWFGGGVYWTLLEHFNIGLEGKYSYAEITLFDIGVNAGGGHFGLLVGYHW